MSQRHSPNERMPPPSCIGSREFSMIDLNCGCILGLTITSTVEINYVNTSSEPVKRPSQYRRMKHHTTVLVAKGSTG